MIYATYISVYFPTELPRMGATPTYTYQSNLNIIEIYSYQDLFLKRGTQNLCITQETKENGKQHKHKCDRKDEHEHEELVDGLTKFFLLRTWI